MACKNFLKLNNGLNMPALGIGTWMAPDAEIESALNLALEAGYRHIDTAPVYDNEKAIGRVLKSFLTSNKIKREDLFITTKLPPPANRPSDVEKTLKSSLADLDLSYIDLYLIHCPFSVVPTDGPEFATHENGDVILDTTTDHVAIWKKMEEMVAKGLVKSIGVSNFNSKQIQRLIDNSKIKPASLQVELHVYFQQKDLVEFCQKNDIIVTAYAPLGSMGVSNLNKSRGIDREIPSLLANEEVGKIAKNHNKTPAQVLIRWIIQRGVAAIPKSTNPDRLKQNLNVFDFQLTADDMTVLSKLDRGFRVCDFSFFKGIKKHPEFAW